MCVQSGNSVEECAHEAANGCQRMTFAEEQLTFMRNKFYYLKMYKIHGGPKLNYTIHS